MNFVEFISEFKAVFPDATPEQVLKAWDKSGFAPSNGILCNLL